MALVSPKHKAELEAWIRREAPHFLNMECFTSLRYDLQLLDCTANTRLHGHPSPYYMLPYHRDRITEAAEHFNWAAFLEVLDVIYSEAGVEELEDNIGQCLDSTSETPLRVRIAFKIDGKFTITSAPTPKKRIGDLFPIFMPTPGEIENGDDGTRQIPSTDNPWTVVVDTQDTTPSSFTTYKTSRREMYDAARERAGVKDFTEPKEVLLINDQGEIMEGSLTTVILWRNERWTTPALISGGQKGTTRRWLVENQLVEVEVIMADTLRDGEHVWLSNGVRGMIYGRLKLSDAQSRDLKMAVRPPRRRAEKSDGVEPE